MKKFSNVFKYILTINLILVVTISENSYARPSGIPYNPVVCFDNALEFNYEECVLVYKEDTESYVIYGQTSGINDVELCHTNNSRNPQPGILQRLIYKQLEEFRTNGTCSAVKE